MKSYQLSDILFIILKKIVYVNEKNKALQIEMLFSDFFLSRWWPGGTLTDIIMCKWHQSSTRQTESVRHRAGCRELNE